MRVLAKGSKDSAIESHQLIQSTGTMEMQGHFSKSTNSFNMLETRISILSIAFKYAIVKKMKNLSGQKKELSKQSGIGLTCWDCNT